MLSNLSLAVYLTNTIFSIEQTCVAWRSTVWAALVDLDVDCEAGYFDDDVLRCLSAKPLHNLRFISAFGIYTTNSFSPIHKLLIQCESLARLSVTFENGFYLEGGSLQPLLQYAKRLTELELKNVLFDSNKDTYEVLSAIATSCPELTALEISSNPDQLPIQLEYDALTPLLSLLKLECLFLPSFICTQHHDLFFDHLSSNLSIQPIGGA